MRPFFIPTLLLMIALLTSACGAGAAPAVPTVGTLDLQGTVAAAAFTVIAETQAAIPTTTPVPPTATFTNTPLPTLTSIPLSLPSAGVTLTPVSSGGSGGNDPCINKTLPEALTGKPIRIRLNNSTKATVSVTVYLNQTVPQSVCGYRSYTIDPQQSIVLNNFVGGCYTIWAWNPDPDAYFIATNGTNCLDTTDTWVFDISTNDIKLGP